MKIKKFVIYGFISFLAFLGIFISQENNNVYAVSKTEIKNAPIIKITRDEPLVVPAGTNINDYITENFLSGAASIYDDQYNTQFGNTQGCYDHMHTSQGQFDQTASMSLSYPYTWKEDHSLCETSDKVFKKNKIYDLEISYSIKDLKPNTLYRFYDAINGDGRLVYARSDKNGVISNDNEDLDGYSPSYDLAIYVDQAPVNWLRDGFIFNRDYFDSDGSGDTDYKELKNDYLPFNRKTFLKNAKKKAAKHHSRQKRAKKTHKKKDIKKSRKHTKKSHKTSHKKHHKKNRRR